jgi:hypothetical protein
VRTSAAIAVLTSILVGFAGRSLAGTAGLVRSSSIAAKPPVARYDHVPALICLDKAYLETLLGARAFKNSGWFLSKKSKIQDLIKRLGSGEKVSPEEINKALERLRLWF